jgi:hypothetical protein
VRASFARDAASRPDLRALPDISPEPRDQRLAWLVWEEHKQRRLIGGQ